MYSHSRISEVLRLCPRSGVQLSNISCLQGVTAKDVARRCVRYFLSGGGGVKVGLRSGWCIECLSCFPPLNECGRVPSIFLTGVDGIINSIFSLLWNDVFFFGVDATVSLLSEKDSTGVSMVGEFPWVSWRSLCEDPGDLWMNPDHVRTLRTSSSVCCLATGDVGMGDNRVSNVVFLENREDGGKLW